MAYIRRNTSDNRYSWKCIHDWNISTGETRIKIFELCGVLFAVLVVYSIIWVCGVMKASPFQPVPVEVINDASVKFNELVKEENEEKALAGAEGEVN